MAISYCKLDKGVYCVDLNHPDDADEVYYRGKIDLNGDKTKMSDVELSILDNVITIISEPINRTEKHKVI